MADRAIVDRTVTPAPKDYLVAAGVSLLLKAASAQMDGTAAAGAWLPALQLVAPDGTVMWTAFPSTQQAAGASASVSWFPDVDDDAESSGASSYNGVVTSFGPWANWRLAETAGATQAADSSGHGRTLSVAAPCVTFGTSPGLIPTSSATCATITAAGASNVFPLPSLAAQTYSASAVSIEVWFNTSTLGREQIFTSFGRLDSQRTWMLQLNTSGQPVFTFLDAGAVLRGATFAVGLADGANHQLVVVMDGVNISCYVDGVFVSSQAAGAGLNVPATHTVYVDQPPGGVVDRSFIGKLGPVVVYDKALSAANVAALYNTATGTTSGGAVASVTAADGTITIGGTAVNPTVSAGPINAIAAAHPTTADWSNNSHKITSVTDPSNPQDAATKNYVDTHGGGGVASVTAADTSIVVGGTGTNPTVRTATLDVIAADHPAAADWSNNSHKITSVTAGAAAGEAAIWDQTPAGIVTAKGDLISGTGSHAAARVGVGSDGQVLIADSTQGGGVRWGAGSSSGSNVNIQTFSAGAGQTWTKPAGVTNVRVIAVSGGGGGGGGAGGAAATTRHGGSGGGGGGRVVADYLASDLAGTVTINVGSGGPNGAGGSSAAGAVGTVGGNTTFGSLLTAFGGGAGAGGSSSTTLNGIGGGGGGAGSAASPGSNNTSNTAVPGAGQDTNVRGYGAMGGAGYTSNSGGLAGAEWGGGGGNGGSAASFTTGGGGASVYGGGGGGGGGGVNSGNSGQAASAGGNSGTYGAGGGGGAGAGGATGSAGTAGANGTTSTCGQGGGGGGAGTGGTGGKGGNGGLYGGGGGGGGGGTTVGGAGGTGGDGLCIVLSW